MVNNGTKEGLKSVKDPAESEKKFRLLKEQSQRRGVEVVQIKPCF
jgi:hypothetical protein